MYPLDETCSFSNVSDEATTDMPEINEDTISPELETSEKSFTSPHPSQTNSDYTGLQGIIKYILVISIFFEIVY